MSDKTDNTRDIAKERLELMEMLAKAGQDWSRKDFLKEIKNKRKALMPEAMNPSLGLNVKVTNTLKTEKIREMPSVPISQGNVGTKLETGSSEYIPVHVIDKKSNKRYLFQSPKLAFLREVNLCQKSQVASRDITIECNLSTYKWFHNWLKDELSQELDSITVLPLLEFANSLEITKLEDICLRFWRLHIDEIDGTDEMFKKISENAKITFSKMFTNQDLPRLRKQTFLQNYLYKKFISFLSEDTSKQFIGHFASTSSLFKCRFCEKILTWEMSRFVLCMNVTLNVCGDVEPCHKETAGWTLSEFIQNLNRSLKSSQLVYWRLWGFSHNLHCCICKEDFPVCQMNWCAFHSSSPQYASDKSQVGRFPCCKEPSFRFETITRKSGCVFRPHIPKIQSPMDSKILSIYQLHNALIDMAASKSSFPIRSIQMDLTTILKLNDASKKKLKDKSWSSKLSTGWNQDNQRELEEKKFKHLKKALTAKCSKEVVANPKPLGGTYVAISCDFWSNFNKETDKEVIRK